MIQKNYISLHSWLQRQISLVDCYFMQLDLGKFWIVRRSWRHGFLDVIKFMIFQWRQGAFLMTSRLKKSRGSDRHRNDLDEHRIEADLTSRRREQLRPTGVGFNSSPRGVLAHSSSTYVWDNNRIYSQNDSFSYLNQTTYLQKLLLSIQLAYLISHFMVNYAFIDLKTQNR